jgi:hypothetical protein
LASLTRTIATELNFQDALKALSREERFMATVSAMNSLLISKGVYSSAEFEKIFVEWAAAQVRKPKSSRTGKR